MKTILSSFLRQLFFWILFFNFTRLIFILYHLDIVLVEKITFPEILGIFYHSLQLDLATACYILVIPFLLLSIQAFWSPRWLNTINKVYSSLLIVAYSLTAAGEMGIYPEWKTKLTYKVIKYLRHPDEIFNSAESGTFYLLILMFIVLSVVGTLAYLKLFYRKIDGIRCRTWQASLFILVMPGLLFIGLRGGTQEIPINQSQSYYSDHNILNLAAVNNAFNLYISIFENLQNFDHNPYVFMDSREAARIMKKIYLTPADSTQSILRTDRPNIILLILESWSADLIEDLGGKPGITPQFRKWQKEGILFTQVYASGSRSEQGMASIFGGFPAHPVSSITVQPDKFVKLPSLVRTLETAGYSSSFYFGGQLIYGNIRSYIIFNGFDKIMEGADFPAALPRGKLGIHDEFTLTYLVRDAGKMKQPFFASLFTLSTHSPWDQPFGRPLNWGDNEYQYINAAYYTDHCLGKFFAEAKTKSWYDNTLFIIVADHSHNSYRNWHPHSKEYHLIPMMFLGNAIREEFRGTVCSKLGNQHDIAATLLAQLGLPSDAFHYSKNLLNRYAPDFAYFTTEDGVGWISPRGYFTWDKTPDYYYWWTDPNLPDSVRLEGKAYLQTVFEEYMRN